MQHVQILLLMWLKGRGVMVEEVVPKTNKSPKISNLNLRPLLLLLSCHRSNPAKSAHFTETISLKPSKMTSQQLQESNLTHSQWYMAKEKPKTAAWSSATKCTTISKYQKRTNLWISSWRVLGISSTPEQNCTTFTPKKVSWSKVFRDSWAI